MLLLEFLDGLQSKTPGRPVRRQFEYRGAVAIHDYRLAPLDLARELGEPILRLANGHGFHGMDFVATCGHKVNGTPGHPPMARPPICCYPRL